jgi:hypothetical protein
MSSVSMGRDISADRRVPSRYMEIASDSCPMVFVWSRGLIGIYVCGVLLVWCMIERREVYKYGFDRSSLLSLHCFALFLLFL